MKHRHMILSGVATTLLMSAPAFSQSSPPAAEPDRAVAGGDSDDIVVVARKREESLIEAPVSVSAFSADMLAAREIRDYTDLARYTPGFTLQNQRVGRNDRSFQTFWTRGITEGTSTFMDGIPLATGSAGGLNDIERIEVVNGPQSATYGRSSFGGAINFITARPRYEFGINGELVVAGYGEREVKLSVDVPIVNDTLAVKLSGRHFVRGDIYDNFSVGGGLGRQQTTQIAGSILFEPTDNLTIYYRGSYWQDDDGSPPQGRLDQRDYNCATPTSVTGALNYICGAIRSVPANRMVQFNNVGSAVIDWVTGQRGVGGWYFDRDFITDFGMYREAQHHGISFDYELPWLPVTFSGNAGYGSDRRAFITDTSFQNGYTRVTPGTGVVPQPNPFYRNPAAAGRPGFDDLLPVYSRTAAGSTMQTAESAELRLSSSSRGRFEWMIGGNYLRSPLNQLTNAFNNDGFGNPGLDTLTESQTLGLFGTVSYAFPFGIRLIAEGRLQRDKIIQRVNTVGGVDASAVFNSITPRFIVQYSPNARLNIYASYSEGVRPGGFNASLFSRDPRIVNYIQTVEAPGIQLTVPEETIEMWEVGFKGRLFNDRLNLVLAAYKARWTGRQVTQNVSFPGTPVGDPNPLPPTSFNIIASGGLAELYGFEAQVSLRLSSALSIDATYALAVSEVKEHNCGVCFLLEGDSNPPDRNFGLYPENSGSISVNYERPVFREWEGYVRVNYAYRGRIYADPSELVWTAPGHIVNARIGVQANNLTLELFGRNIFNNRSPTSIGRSTDSFMTTISGVSVSPPDPRTFGARVRFEY